MLVRGGALTATRRHRVDGRARCCSPSPFAVLVSGMVRTTTAAYAAGRADNVNAGWIVAARPGARPVGPGRRRDRWHRPPADHGLPHRPRDGAGGPATDRARRGPGGFAAANRALTVVAGSLERPAR